MADLKETLQDFVDEWVQSLDREDKKGLAMPLCSTLVNELAFTETKAAEFAAKIVHKADRTIRQWRTDLISNNGTFPESKQGRYQRSGVLRVNEELCEKAAEYVRVNAAVKGTPNME
jgi:capsule polysaccharide export protein KpsE/RkpR